MKIAPDKVKHFIVSMLIVLIYYIFFNDARLGMMLSLAVGILKEGYDEFIAGPHTRWDWKDITADCVGVIVGGLICSLI